MKSLIAAVFCPILPSCLKLGFNPMTPLMLCNLMASNLWIAIDVLFVDDRMAGYIGSKTDFLYDFFSVVFTDRKLQAFTVFEVLMTKYFNIWKFSLSCYLYLVIHSLLL